MKLKPLLIFVVVLAALSAIVFWRSRVPVAEPSGDLRVGQPLVARDTLSAARSVVLSTGGQTVTLSADADAKNWTVVEYFGFPVDFGKLATLVDSLQSAKIVRLVTRNPERLERLGFAKDKLELRDAAGKALWSLTLGKNADSGGRFVRYDEEKKGYLADLTAWIDNTAKNWAQAQLLNAKPEDVASLTVNFDTDAALTLKRAASGTGWEAEGLPPNKELKPSVIDSLVSQLASLRFNETTDVGAPEAIEAKAHARTTTVTLKDGTTYAIALGRRPAPPPPPPPPPPAATPDTKSPVPSAEAKSPSTSTETPNAKPEANSPATPAANAVKPNAESTTPKVEPKPAVTTPPPPPPAPGPVYAFITTNRATDPVNVLMQKRSFQIGEWIYNALPASRDSLLQDKPPAPPAPPAPIAAANEPPQTSTPAPNAESKTAGVASKTAAPQPQTPKADSPPSSAAKSDPPKSP